MSFNNSYINNNIKSPCKNCENRYLGCHGQCDNYASYKNNIAQVNNIKFNKYEAERDYMEVIEYGRKNRR